MQNFLELQCLVDDVVGFLELSVCISASLPSIYRRDYGKRANLKTEVTRIQSTPNFPKNERFSENLACFVFLLPPF